jgi:hypothetical protein
MDTIYSPTMNTENKGTEQTQSNETSNAAVIV